jgi:hypothetical protein
MLHLRLIIGKHFINLIDQEDAALKIRSTFAFGPELGERTLFYGAEVLGAICVNGSPGG